MAQIELLKTTTEEEFKELLYIYSFYHVNLKLGAKKSYETLNFISKKLLLVGNKLGFSREEVSKMANEKIDILKSIKSYKRDIEKLEIIKGIYDKTENLCGGNANSFYEELQSQIDFLNVRINNLKKIY